MYTIDKTTTTTATTTTTLVLPIRNGMFLHVAILSLFV